ncbi:MAG: oxidoreductase C-terminal domain-containing protein [Sphingopyxis sp.]
MKAGKVIAIDCVNATKDYVQGRMIVTAGLRTTAERLADTSLPLKELLPV